jgi:hypothetical protein
MPDITDLARGRINGSDELVVQLIGPEDMRQPNRRCADLSFASFGRQRRLRYRLTVSQKSQPTSRGCSPRPRPASPQSRPVSEQVRQTRPSGPGLSSSARARRRQRVSGAPASADGEGQPETLDRGPFRRHVWHIDARADHSAPRHVS